MRLIDVDEFEVISLKNTSPEFYAGVLYMLNMLDKAPTIKDAVPVVRCKYCAHKVDFKGRVMCNKNAQKRGDEWYGLRATNEEFFCAKGERKSDNE